MAEPSPAASGPVPSASNPAFGDPLVSCVSLDFKTKQHKRITVEETQPAMYAGQFIWIDVDIAQTEEARTVLTKLGLCAPEIIEDALSREPATQIARYDDYIHLVLSGCRLSGHKFDLERVDAIMGESFLLTLHKGQPVFLEAVRRSYVKDFERFAKSPSFLLYELWDHLIDNYLSVHKKFEERVELVQTRLIGDVDDAVFAEASELTSDLLHLRKVVLPALLPSILTSFRVAIGMGWMVVVAAELIAAEAGLGYLLIQAYRIFRMDVMIAVMLIIGLLALLMDRGMRWLQLRLLAWQEADR